MRQLAILPTPEAARTLADYLLTVHIDTHLEPLPEGTAVWVRDEDRMPQARKELAEFTSNPADKRFAAARQAAETVRRRQQRQDEEDAAREASARPAPTPSATPRPGPWTYGLMLTCVLVFILHTGYLITNNGGFSSPDAWNILVWGQAKGMAEPTSPVEQALSIASFRPAPGGMIEWNGLEEIEHGQVWRLVTPIFMHFGLIHLVFNMSVLWPFGAAFEERRGAWRFLLFIVVTAAISNLAQYYLDISFKNGELLFQQNPMGGGFSGVLYALFGYIWMKSRYEPALGLTIGPRLVLLLIAWLFLCMTGQLGPVGNTAHVSGLIVGVVIGVAPHLWRVTLGRRPT